MAERRLLSNLLEEISAKYWALQAHIRLLSIPDGRTRLEAYLQQEARKTGEIVCTGMTREQMARYLGMNRSALSRLLGAMQREDRIKLRRGDIRLMKYIETRISGPQKRMAVSTKSYRYILTCVWRICYDLFILKIFLFIS